VNPMWTGANRPGMATTLYNVTGVAVDAVGNVYIVDQGHS
jgi:hypothetical protein